MTEAAIQQPDMQRLAEVAARVEASLAMFTRLGLTTTAADREQYTAEVVSRCRTARDRGTIPGAWSTGEQLLVALVLYDADHLAALDYTPQQAHERVYGDLPIRMSPRQYLAWLNDLRVAT